MLLIYNILILISIALAQIESQTKPCNNQCQKCNELTLECRDLNQNDFTLLKSSYPSTETIIFTGNSLNVINESIVSLELDQLELLDLSNNKIVRFENSSVFKNVPNLFELILDNNQLNLDTKEHFSALRGLSNSLERLSLNRAFTESKSIDYKRSAQIDREILNLLSASRLKNIFELRLKENSLSSFNVKENNGNEDPLDEYDSFEDILCILPKLKVLNLANNFIERIDFDLDCLNENKSSLELLHLESNRLVTVDMRLIDKFKTFYEFNMDFRVQLSNNPFKCDCSLLSFYEWLKTEEATNIVYNKFNLKCTHDDSLASTINKSILSSSLDQFCADVSETTQEPKRKMFFPFRNRTYRPIKRLKTERHNSTSKLLFFLFAVVFTSAMILLVVKFYCKRKWKQKRLNRYTTLDNQYWGTSVDGNRLPTHENDELIHQHAQPKETNPFETDKRYIDRNFGNYLNKVTQMSKRFKKSNDEPEISSLAYQEFDSTSSPSSPNLDETKQSRTSAFNSKKPIKQASDRSDSDIEEQTIMDAAVNNIKFSKKPKNVSPVLYVRNP